MLELLTKPNLLKYSIAALLLAVPLYPKFPFINIPGTYVAVRLEDFLILIVGLVSFAYFLKDRKFILKNNLVIAILIFLSVGFVSLISAIFLTKTVTWHIALLHLVRRIEYFTPLFAGIVLFKTRSRETLEFFIKLLLIVVILAFVYGVGQKYFGWPVIVTQNLEYSKGIALRWIPGAHINSTFAGHYDLATFLVMVMPIFVALFFTVSGRLTRIILALTIFAGLWLLSNAISRISIVSYLFGAGFSLILLKKFKAAVFVVLASLIFFSFSGDLIARYWRVIDVYAQESPTTPKRQGSQSPTPEPMNIFEDRSSSIRLNVEWPRAIRAFSKNPLLGTGYSSITLATDNDYLRLLGEVGLLGFGAFMLIIVRVGRVFFLNLRKSLSNLSDLERGYASGMIASFPGVLLNAFFIDVFEASKFAIIFWLLIGFIINMANTKLNE